MSEYISQGASAQKRIQTMILFTCRAKWKILFDFVKHVVREYGMGASTQIKVVGEILQSFVYLPYKSLRKNSDLPM